AGCWRADPQQGAGGGTAGGEDDPTPRGREERPRADAAEVVARHHAGVLQLPADLRLLEEAPDYLGPMGVLLQQHLDRQVAAQIDVPAAQDSAHAAAGDLALELVAVARLFRRRHGVGCGLED